MCSLPVNKTHIGCGAHHDVTTQKHDSGMTIIACTLNQLTMITPS